jgi:hypothetical protein
VDWGVVCSNSGVMRSTFVRIAASVARDKRVAMSPVMPLVALMIQLTMARSSGM